MKPVFRGQVKSNISFMGTEYHQCLRTLEGQEVSVTVEKHRNTRSLNQNSYYHGVVVKLLSEETGYSTDEMHDILRGMFLGEEAKIGDKIIRYSRSTTLLKTNEFEDYLTQIREWASVELNCYIPLPREIDLDN